MDMGWMKNTSSKNSSMETVSRIVFVIGYDTEVSYTWRILLYALLKKKSKCAN